MLDELIGLGVAIPTGAITGGLAYARYIATRQKAYSWGRDGYLMSLVPTNSALPIYTGRVLVRMVVAATDQRWVRRFERLRRLPHGHVYEIIKPGTTGLIWKGWPKISEVEPWAETEFLMWATSGQRHALPLEQMTLVLEKESEPEELKRIMDDIELTKSNHRATVSPSEAKLLTFVPNQKTRDLIDVRSRIVVIMQSVDPVLSVTRVKFPQDMIRAKLIPLHRDVVAARDFYVPRTTVAKNEAEAKEQALLLTTMLTQKVHGDLQKVLGITNGDRSKPILTDDGDISPEWMPEPGSPAAEILEQWGYLIREVTVQDVEEVSGTITAALQKVVEQEAIATADRQRAEGVKATTILEEQGRAEAVRIRADAELYAADKRGQGFQKEFTARLQAFSQNGLITPMAINSFLSWLSMDVLRDNKENSKQTFFVWPNLQPQHSIMEPFYKGIQDYLAHNPDLMADPSRLKSLIDQLGSVFGGGSAPPAVEPPQPATGTGG